MAKTDSDYLIVRSMTCEAEMVQLLQRLVDRRGLNNVERLAIAELLFAHLRRQATPAELSASDALVQRRKEQWDAAEKDIIAFAEKLKRN